MRDRIVQEARNIIGAEWVHQGRNPGTGIDCIGVIVWVANKVGLEFSDRTNYGREPVGQLLVEEVRERLIEIPIEEAQHGDVLILRTAGKPLPTHIAILANGDKELNLIHSIQIGQARKTVEEPYRRWKRLVTNAFKFKEVI
jgi:cell wall-associated NlpC family hydrolase